MFQNVYNNFQERQEQWTLSNQDCNKDESVFGCWRGLSFLLSSEYGQTSTRWRLL